VGVGFNDFGVKFADVGHPGAKCVQAYINSFLAIIDQTN